MCNVDNFLMGMKNNVESALDVKAGFEFGSEIRMLLRSGLYRKSLC